LAIELCFAHYVHVCAETQRVVSLRGNDERGIALYQSQKHISRKQYPTIVR